MTKFCERGSRWSPDLSASCCSSILQVKQHQTQVHAAVFKDMTLDTSKAKASVAGQALCQDFPLSPSFIDSFSRYPLPWGKRRHFQLQWFSRGLWETPGDLARWWTLTAGYEAPTQQQRWSYTRCPSLDMQLSIPELETTSRNPEPEITQELLARCHPYTKASG